MLPHQKDVRISTVCLRGRRPQLGPFLPRVRAPVDLLPVDRTHLAAQLQTVNVTFASLQHLGQNLARTRAQVARQVEVWCEGEIYSRVRSWAHMSVTSDE